MAGDWIKVEHATPDKPEVYTMATILGIDPDAVVGKLVRFWTWCDQQSISGNALTVTDSVLDRITHQPGFSDALRKVAWLEVRSGSLQVPRFDRHNGQTSKARAVCNRRVADHRNKCNAPSVTNVTPTALEKPLPEKRREEKSNTSSKEEVGVEFPANLKSADFGAAWESYLAYRKSSRLKSLAPASIQAQLRNLSEMGHDAAIAAINQSIANGWQGIFPPKEQKPMGARKPVVRML